jgi:predicted TIM-barrel fold metal-dependent hydrolase
MPQTSPNACDTHVHVFDPQRFPYQPRRAYTPPAASMTELLALHATLGVERVVLVQPSVYGTDNACLLNAIETLGQPRARGVAVVDLDAATPDTLHRLHDGGVRGLRLNLHVGGEGLHAATQQVQQAGRLLKPLGWHLQVHASLATHAQLLNEFQHTEIPIVVDHYAGGLTTEPGSEAQLEQLLRAFQHTPLWVKLSAPYRLAAHMGGTGDTGHAHRLATAFTQAAPDRVLWGSDWPHTGGTGPRGGGAASTQAEAFRTVDNPQVLNDLLACLPDHAQRHRLLVSNPVQLYGF